MEERPILIDEQRQTRSVRTWRAVDPKELRERRFAEIEKAIDKARADKRNGRRRIVICPITPTGRKLAARAAAERRDVEVSGFQVWIIEGVRTREGERTVARWMVMDYGDASRRRTSRHETDVNEAVERIRTRHKDAAIRLVTTSAEGERETTEVGSHPNTARGGYEPGWP